MRRLHFVKVFTTDVELELTISDATTGLQLFQQVCETIGIREVWHFGINYLDKYDEVVWLDLNKRVVKQIGGEKGTIYLKFCVKYYPEDVQSELIFETTQRLFYLHVKNDILDGKVYCSLESAILLASYACQVKFGDYDEDTMKPGFLSKEKLIPQRIMKNRELSAANIEITVVQWYCQFTGMLRSDAMMEYLRTAQDLEMYGVTYFPVKNKRGTDILIGVDAFGLNIYPENDRLTPKLGFPWSEISTVNFRRLKFVVTPVDKQSKDLILFSSHVRYNQRLFSLCIGTHELYTRRRCPESVEVQHMRAQASADREQRLRERARLNIAVQAQLEAEKKLQLLMADMACARTEQERADQNATELAKRVKALEQQLQEEAILRKELQEAQQRLIEHNNQLEKSFAKSEGDRNRFLEEKASIESQIVALKRSVLRSSFRVEHQKAAIAQISKLPMRKWSLFTHPPRPGPLVTDSREKRTKETYVSRLTDVQCTKEPDVTTNQLTESQGKPAEFTPTSKENHSSTSSFRLQLDEANPMQEKSKTQVTYPEYPKQPSEVVQLTEFKQCTEQSSDTRNQCTESNIPNRISNESSKATRPVSHPQYDVSRHSIYRELNLNIQDADDFTGRLTRPGSIQFWKVDNRYESVLKIRHGNTKKRVDLFESM